MRVAWRVRVVFGEPGIAHATLVLPFISSSPPRRGGEPDRAPRKAALPTFSLPPTSNRYVDLDFRDGPGVVYAGESFWARSRDARTGVGDGAGLTTTQENP